MKSKFLFFVPLNLAENKPFHHHKANRQEMAAKMVLFPAGITDEIEDLTTSI
jgi:hypothetical protein